jgi:hypothetical protein
MLELALRVSVDVPDPVILFGDGTAVRPTGGEDDKVTVPLNPF